MNGTFSEKWVPDRNTFIHLRLVFSFFLLPVFIFAISQAAEINLKATVIIFLVLHFFIYPASNAYNSFMDRDSGSIGGLKSPPPVNDKLFYSSILLDFSGLLLCFLVSYKLVIFMLIYTGISRLYSWRKTRIKKYPIAGWLTVMLFQGGYTYLMVIFFSDLHFHFSSFEKIISGMVISSLLIGGYYPLTQIYQHEEDSSRGDITISFKLGIEGTFRFTMALFLSALFVSFFYFKIYYSIQHFLILVACFIPAVIYFFYWWVKCRKNSLYANYDYAMRMTSLSSACMIICFSSLLLLNHGGR